MRLRVKICCMALPDEAALAASAGADLAGLVGPIPSGAGVIQLFTARHVPETVCAWATPFLPTCGGTAGELARQVALCPVRCVQLVRDVGRGVHHAMAARLSGLRRIQVVGLHICSGVRADGASSLRSSAPSCRRRAYSRSALGGWGS